MPPIASPIRKRNALWPLRKSSKGWGTGTLGERYRAAMHHLVRTPLGSIIWAPTFGTRLHQFRTQSINEAEQTLLFGELQRSIGLWIPDIVVISFSFGRQEARAESSTAKVTAANPDSETLEVLVVWGIPDATSIGARAGEPRFAFGPVRQVVSV